MRRILPVLIAIFIVQGVKAQQDASYAEKAQQIQKDVWGNASAEFKITTVPANLSNESAVILARAFSLQRSSKPRLKFMAMGAGVATRSYKLTTYHERVKINDKTALDEFSTLEYQKKLDNTVSFLFSKVVNVTDTYIGAKIIKPNGTETIVNTSEEVLLKNDQKDQKGKLAIPGLQVGDIIDYYISTAVTTETQNSYRDNDNVLILVDIHPILYFSVDFQFSKKIYVQYISANGAPQFEQNTDDNEDLLLSLKVRNVPKYQAQLWTSPLRQYPYVEVGSTSTKDKTDSRLEAIQNGYQASFTEFPGFNEPAAHVKALFGSKKNLKEAPLDSVVKVLYDVWKFEAFCGYSADELQEIDELNYRSARSLFAAELFCMNLKALGIDGSVVLVAPRNANTLDNAFTSDDVDALVMIDMATPYYFAFDDVVTHFNEIPARYQGEHGIELFPQRRNGYYTFTNGLTTLPVDGADKNVREENLTVSILPGDAQKLSIRRLVKETGQLRHSDQKLLLPVQDVDDGYQKIAKGEDLSKRLKSSTDTKKLADDFGAAFAKEKGDMTKNFTEEVKNQYDQDPEQLQDPKIITPALEVNDPVFQFSESFTLKNMVKKAGNNYIVDIGKLTGSFYSLEDKDRKRTVDIYMPCARTFKYNISFAIPPGANVKGIEELTFNKANKTGSFSSTAVVDKGVLTLKVIRVYKNNFEKAADWPMMVDLIDAASSFNSKKILLQR